MQKLPRKYVKEENLSQKIQTAIANVVKPRWKSWKAVSVENVFRPSGKKGFDGDIIVSTSKQGKQRSCQKESLKPCAGKVRKICEGFYYGYNQYGKSSG